MTLDGTHTGIRHILSLQSEHVYKDNILVETSINVNYCAIFRCLWNVKQKSYKNISMVSCHVGTGLLPIVKWCI